MPGALAEGALARKSVKSLGGETGLGKERGGRGRWVFLLETPTLQGNPSLEGRGLN